MHLVDWTFVVLGIGIGLIALLFAIFQFFNKRGSSKALVLKKSLLIGGIATIALYTVGIMFWVEFRIDSIEQFQIVGRVVDKNNRDPIADAKVTLEYRGTPKIQYTDSEGIFSFRVEPNKNLNEAKIGVDAENYGFISRIVSLRKISNVEEFFLTRTNIIKPPTEPAKNPDKKTDEVPLDTMSEGENRPKEQSNGVPDSTISRETEKVAPGENEPILIRRIMSGRVLTRRNGYPLPLEGVVVIVNNGETNTTTDKSGFFKIAISDTTLNYAALSFDKAGYVLQTREFIIPKPDIQVFLKEVNR